MFLVGLTSDGTPLVLHLPEADPFPNFPVRPIKFGDAQ
jgi:hypothetical protein